MQTAMIAKEFSQARERLLTLAVETNQLAARMRSAWQETSGQLVRGVHAPFLFVVVGEVKSGKSSLVNALLGEAVCEVAPDPCTDVIQKLVYSERPSERQEADDIRERGLPHPVLKDIAIVDTPGTNSILEHHQTLTERFIPQSDLALFVFHVLNPYSGTAWELLRFVHQRWRKKIVFVLQQADRATPEELAVNRRRVEEYARERGMEDPKIFIVSAKRDMEGGDPGLTELRAFITETVTGGRHYRMKLESLLGTMEEIVAGLSRELDDEERALAEDRREAALIDESLTRGQETAQSEMELLRARVLEAYDRSAAQAVESFEQGLSLGGMLRNTLHGLFGRKNALKDWIEGLHREFEERFTREVESLAAEAAGRSTQHLSRLMEGLVEQLRRGKPRHVGLSSLAGQRLEVLEEVRGKVFALLHDESFSGRMRPKNLHSLGDRALVGGFLTAVGAVLAASIHAVAFDVTGGVLAALGALLAIHTIIFRRGAAVRGFRQGFDQGREHLERELGRRLSPQVEAIFADLRAAFAPFHELVRTREKELAELRHQAASLGENMREQRETLENAT